MQAFEERRNHDRKTLADELIHWFDVSHGKHIAAHMLLALSTHRGEAKPHQAISR